MTPAERRQARKEAIFDVAAPAVRQYMSAVAFVVAWSDDAGLQDYGENVNARKLGHGAGVPVLPMHAVFQTHMDLGGWVVRWASNASEKERDALLGMMPAVAFNKKCYKANAKDAPTAAADAADGDYGSGIARAKGGGSGGGGGGGGVGGSGV